MNDGIFNDIKLAQSGDRKKAEKIVEENAGLIWSVVRRFLGRGVDADDLYQLGCMGLLKAIDGFDEGFGTRFSTYAVPKISGEIRRFLRDDGAVKVSRGVKEQAAQIRSARSMLEQRIGREPTLSELEWETGISAEEIVYAETATGPAESLQKESGEDGFSLELVLGDYGAEEKMLERVAVKSAIDKLPERERQVIALRFFHGMTQQNCARVLHVSQVQISRLERRAIDALRLLLEETEG
ncbi:MAG: sigma-70 family RNA polymerase sigma factor [Oscillospiraceae bacterium]|nr:sigma-70 family RNA polymerase sigma factor [Oscillospiraceae bacterium]